jgi:transcriptional regulator with XRE-family HTH domain
MVEVTGQEVQSIRKRLGLPVSKFAAVLGVHPSSVFRWESRGDQAVPIEGIPLSVLSALRLRLAEEGDEAREAREAGRAVSDALIVGGALIALLLLIKFASGSK